MRKVTIFGELLIDHKTFQGKEVPPSPGGPPLFISSVFKNLPARLSLVTYYGEDFPKEWIPENINVLPPAPTVSLNPRYFLSYKNGARTLKINSIQSFQAVLPSNVSNKELDSLHEPDIIFFCSTLPIYTPEHVITWHKTFPGSKIVLLAQGWLRQAKEDGTIEKQDPKILFSWLDEVGDYFQAIILSEADHDAEVVNNLINKYSDRTIIAVTRGINPATLTYQKNRVEIPTRWLVTNLIDSTGAGDRWAGVFSYEYFINKKSIEQSALQAHRETAKFL